MNNDITITHLWVKKNIFYTGFAFLYFFFNIAGLPFGLTYMTLLAPIFYGWVLLKRKQEVLLPLITILLPFIIAHLFFIKVEEKEYAFSMLNIIAVYIFGQAFFTWLKIADNKEHLFKLLLQVNFFLCLVAILFYFSTYHEIFWIKQNLTSKVEDFLRLKMFTYEASYYALVFTPIFLFFFLQYILGQNTINKNYLLIMLFLPFVLSFSIGVIVCLIAAGILTTLVQGSLLIKRRVINGIITVGFISVLLLAVTFIFSRDNPFFLRIENIILGNDSSATGRTSDAFILTNQILQEKNLYWGIGLGQLNIVGEDIIRAYYLYHYAQPVAIPNVSAETLALLGWIGLILRICIELFFFFYTKVWRNYFRLMLFFFIFLYQFTGSYITNLAEYVIWIMAFTNVFPAFNVRKKNTEALIQ